MRTHNIYQDTAAARLNAIQCLKEDTTVQKYIDTSSAEVLYVIHWNEEY